MRHKRWLPLVALLAIGALVAGILTCFALGTLVAGSRIGVRSAFLKPSSTAPRATVTHTPMSPAGRPTTGVTPMLPTMAQSPIPLPTATPPPASPTSPSTPDSTAAQTPTDIAGAPTTVATGTPVIPTSGPTDTPEPSASPTNTPQPPSPTAAPTETPSPTPVVVTPRGPARVTGRLVKDGVPVPAGVTVKLEDQTYAIVAMATTDAQGIYTFDNLTISDAVVNVLFAQEWNEQYSAGEVASWAWLGPLAVSRGTTVQLPDLEIGLRGFEQVSPRAGTSFSASQISAQNPLIFEWAAYPGASAYWVDLAKGDDLNIVWQSALVNSTTVAFDGRLGDGSSITTDTYWWGVGARAGMGNYQLTVYGYLPSFVVAP